MSEQRDEAHQLIWEMACARLKEIDKAIRSQVGHHVSLSVEAAIKALPDRALLDKLPERLSEPVKRALARLEVHFAATLCIDEIERQFPYLTERSWMSLWRPSDAMVS